MKKLLLAGIAALFLATGVQAQDRTVIGYQNFSCGTWVSTRAKGQAAKAEAWILGFLSGSNLESLMPDFLTGKDANGIEIWIDNYCRANPLASIITAAVDLRNKLQSESRPK